MQKLFLVFSVAVATTQAANAQKYSNEFLSIGVGAHAQGRANACVASIGDVTAGYWNPAGLTNMGSDLQASFMHAEWFGSIANYDYGAIARPVGDKNRFVALSFIRFGIDNIPNTLSLYRDGQVNYDNIKPFSAADYAIMFSYAQKLKTEGLSVGGNVKVVHHKIGPFATAWGFGLDAGMQYARKNWKFGAMAHDITSTFNAWKFNLSEEDKQVLELTNNEVPQNSVEITRPRLTLGAAWGKDFVLNKKGVAEGKKERTLGFSAEVNLDMTTDGRRNVLISSNPLSFDPYMGVELSYNKLVYFRTGVNNVQQVTDIDNNKSWAVQPNFGVGLKIWKFRIDYALGNVGNSAGLLYSHIISLIADLDFLGKKKGAEAPN